MSKPWLAPDVQADLAGLTEAQVAICTLYGEARSEPLEGIVAVANVLRNRVQDGRWGADYRAVCLAPWQFSCWTPVGGQRNYERVLALVRQMRAATPITDAGVRELTYIMHGVLRDGWLRDTVRGATHYHVAAMQPRPAWAQTVAPVKQVGHHVFYTGIR